MNLLLEPGSPYTWNPYRNVIYLVLQDKDGVEPVQGSMLSDRQIDAELSTVSYQTHVRVVYCAWQQTPPSLWLISILLSQIINGLNSIPLFESKE